MKRLIYISVLTFMSFALRGQHPCVSSDWEQPYAPDTLICYKTVGNVSLYLHIFLPDTHQVNEQHACIVFFFGGGWNVGSTCQFYPHASHFSSCGMVAVCAEYRIRSLHATTPYESVADAKTAMRWLRIHSAHFGIDTSKIVASGGSAGGHLATCTAAIPAINDPADDQTVNPVPNALVLFNPALDFDEEKSTKRFGPNWKEIVPLFHLSPGMPPAIIFHGEADRTVSVDDIRIFCGNLDSLGIKNELHTYEGMDHGFFNYKKGDNPFYFDTLNKAETFLVSLGFLEKP